MKVSVSPCPTLAGRQAPPASVTVLEAAVTATKSLDDKVLGQWLKKNRVDTIIGRVRFDGPNNYGDDLSKIKQVQDGKWVVVWPKEWAAPGARLLGPGSY